MRAVVLSNAAMQRDVLRARAGMLRNYDPLVASTDAMAAAAARLQGAGDIAGGAAGHDIDERAREVATAAATEAQLVEVFKSQNALLQNSLSYFSHAIAEITKRGDSPTAEIGALAITMSRFIADPGSRSATEATTLLDTLLRRAAAGSEAADLQALVSHGRFIVATLPAVDDLVVRLQAAATSTRVRALQDRYLDAHMLAAERATLARFLLYAAAVALVGYVALLFLRLRAKARALEARLAFERLLASISTQFIDHPRERLGEAVEDGLRRLAGHANLDRASIVTLRNGKSEIGERYAWQHATSDAPACRADDVLAVTMNWRLSGYEREGCTVVEDVRALPDGAEKTSLLQHGVRSWLCTPLSRAGRLLGFLTLETSSRTTRWHDDDIALIRLAGDIFAHVIERERAEIERESLEARLHQAHRLEAIGTLAGGIAHEFNNILGAILGHAELALASLGQNVRARRHVSQIITAGERVQSVTDQILAFGRRRERERRPIRAQTVVADTIELLRASLPATLSIDARFLAPEATILADPGALQQVVMNLCTNASHAVGGRGTIIVALDAVELGGPTVLSHGTLPGGRHVRLSVRDSGHGIDAALLDRIIEPFFTTKPAGQGTGLGLSTVHGVVAQHGGALNVESVVGRGSTFEVYFPQTHDETVATMQPSETTPPRGRGETVLLVDDDETVVQHGEEMLAALGYEPVGFSRCSSALDAFRAAPNRFDLALVDEAMPEMAGITLAQTLHELRPELPVVLMTGNDRALQARRWSAAGIREVLAKPPSSAAIAACLARHLRAHPSAQFV
jgi:signal transduction histidine kinase/ActR/RegA family two-component response regulator